MFLRLEVKKLNIFNPILLILSLIASLIILKKNIFYISLKRVNIITFPYYVHFILFSFLGMFLISIGKTDHYILSNIKNPMNFNYGLWSYIAMILLIPIGMTIASLLFNFKSNIEVPSYYKKNIKLLYSNRDAGMIFVITVLLILSTIAVIYTFITIRSFPLLDVLFSNNEIVAGRIRIIVAREFSGLIIFRNLFGLVLTPLLSYVCFSYYLSIKDKTWRNLFYYSFFLSFLILTYDLSKSPIIIYFLGLLTIYSMIKRQLKLGQIFRYGLASLILIFFMYIIIFQVKSGLFQLNSGPIGRIVYGQISALYLTFETFPEKIGFLNGMSFPQILGGEDLRSAKLIMDTYNQRAVIDGIAGVMNTLFIAEAYANFGFYGIVFSSLYVGFLFQIFFILFIRIEKSPINIAFFTYFCTKIPFTGGFVDFFYNPFLIFVICIYWLIILISKFSNKHLVIKY